MRKNLVKAIATTAMIGAMFIGGNKLTVNANSWDDINNGKYTWEELDAKIELLEAQFCAMKGVTMDQVYMDIALVEEFTRYQDSVLFPDMTYDEVLEACLQELSGKGIITDGNEIANSVTTKHEDMLAKVNADRKANGAAALVWDADLEAVARQRAIEIMDNVQTDEFMDAYDAGNTKKINEIVHKGYTLKENAIVAFESGVKSKTANDNWIASKGHHIQRIKKGWTKYACASYIDPLTDTEIWVEVFADNSFEGASSFDYIRYAKDYPDLAAAFGQDKNALYKHYRTYGRNEGRKAYNTDGTLIK